MGDFRGPAILFAGMVIGALIGAISHGNFTYHSAARPLADRRRSCARMTCTAESTLRKSEEQTTSMTDSRSDDGDCKTRIPFAPSLSAPSSRNKALAQRHCVEQAHAPYDAHSGMPPPPVTVALMGRSPTFLRAVALIMKAAQWDATV